MVHTFSLCLYLSFFFLHRVIFPPHIWSRCSILHTSGFSLDTVFSSVAGFAFELNQINLRTRQRYSLCACRTGGGWAGSGGERTGAVCALRRPSLAHTSYFQLVIVATAAAPPCCFFSCRASTWQPILKLLLAGHCSTLRMCIPQLKRNVFLTSFDHRFHDFF